MVSVLHTIQLSSLYTMPRSAPSTVGILASSVGAVKNRHPSAKPSYYILTVNATVPRYASLFKRLEDDMASTAPGYRQPRASEWLHATTYQCNTPSNHQPKRRARELAYGAVVDRATCRGGDASTGCSSGSANGGSPDCGAIRPCCKSQSRHSVRLGGSVGHSLCASASDERKEGGENGRVLHDF